MIKKLIQKLLGTEIVEVTYRVTDVSPRTRNIGPY
ncbi:putative baseplate hub [Escherichia phage vB_EcoM_ESCO47]|nr:putative baseplate hub [Escherichia phage vB_EcoM_ESCO47]